MTRKTFINFGENKDHTIDYLLGILEDARATTLWYVQNITVEELDWQYEKGWNTVGALLAHIIAAGHVFRIEFIEGRALTKEESKIYMPGLKMGKYIPELINACELSEYLKRLKHSKEKLEEEIKKLDTKSFHKKREGYNPETGNNLAWVLYHLAEDEVHHRGQISIIRKLYKSVFKGAKV